MSKLGRIRTALEQHGSVTVVDEKEIVSYVDNPDLSERLSRVAIYISPAEPMTFAHLAQLQMELFDDIGTQTDESVYYSKLRPELGVMRFRDTLTDTDDLRFDQEIIIKVYRDPETAQRSARSDNVWVDDQS